MEKHKKKFTILASTTLLLILFMSGCGNNIEDASVDNQDTQVITEMAGTEIETEIVADTEEFTEVMAEEEPETEEEVIAIGYSMVEEGCPIVMEFPSLENSGEEIDRIQDDDKVNILGEYYNEEEQKTFLRVRLDNGKKGYVIKDYIYIVE